MESWNVYLPGPDNWVWFWDQFEHQDLIPGNQWISVYAPIGFTPVFYRYESEFKDLFKTIANDFGTIDEVNK